MNDSTERPNVTGKRRYMISCAARTGSTLLVHYLRSHSRIMSYGELFSPRISSDMLAGKYRKNAELDVSFADRLTRSRDENPVAFLYKFAFDAQGKSSVGFKLKYDELVLSRLEEVKRAIIEDTDIKIILLRRKNLLARYLSWYLVNHVTNRTVSTDRTMVADTPPVKLEPNSCKMDFEMILRREQMFRDLFSGHSMFEITYEELVTYKNHVLSELQDFLSVPEQVLTSKTQQLRRNQLCDAISNFDELAAYFKATKYSTFFE